MTSLVDHSFHRLLIRYLRWARSAAPFRLNAHLKVAPAQCVYGFIFRYLVGGPYVTSSVNVTINAVVRLISLQ